jgi:hypothetical protein
LPENTLCLSIMLGSAPLALAAAGDGNWTEYNGDKAGSRYLAGGKSVGSEREVDEGRVALGDARQRRFRSTIPNCVPG